MDTEPEPLPHADADGIGGGVGMLDQPRQNRQPRGGHPQPRRAQCVQRRRVRVDGNQSHRANLPHFLE
ncbi:MAG: hypothetical protein WKF47_10170 [Geodermatophilaceae bacterium]